MFQTGILGGSTDVKRFNTEKIDTLLHIGTLESCRDIIDGFFEEIGFDQLQSLMLRLYVSMDIYLAASSFARELGISDEQFIESYGSIDEIATHLQTTAGTISFFSDMISQCIRWRIGIASEKNTSIVEKARDYIDTHYMNEELSLRTVADFVGLSPTYFSVLFKKEIGLNFSDYLTRIRIRKSKNLLCCTSKMIYEVAYEVGFRDYRYFSQIFKKHTGQTPRQFQTTANAGT